MRHSGAPATLPASARPLIGAGVVALIALQPVAAQTVQPVAAQTVAAPPTASRADENAVRQAGDAFGTSVGRETIGLYNQTNVRGFSPVAAGSVRIEGLYFDPVIVPSVRLARSTTIHVGLSALGNPFPAPTGIVDFGFRRPGDKAAASVQLGADAWGTVNAELDAVVPVSPSLSLGLGASARRESTFNATLENKIGGAISARWTPTDTLTLVPFVNITWSLYDDHGAQYLPAGDYLPPPIPRRVRFGPSWVHGTNAEANIGVLGDWKIAPQWLLRAGLFRSSRVAHNQSANLVRDLLPDGTGRQRILADPPLDFASISGEIRLTRLIDDGPRQHRIHAAVRGRAGDRRFGGGDSLDLGPVDINIPSQVPQQFARFGPQQRDKVRQYTGGLAYEGRWDGVGEVSAGLQYSSYKKRIDVPTGGIQATDAKPLLYNITVAANLSQRLVVYAGAVTGLEESGIAPGNAANRNEALPAIRTRQFDAGLRFAITEDVKLVAGVFDISKPYFNLDANNRFGPLGDAINRGVEASVAGPVTPQLSLVAGAVLLWPKVTGDAVTTGRIGPRPVGAISNRFEISADWRPPFLPGISFDTRLAYRSPETATVGNLAQIPVRKLVDIGARYRFKLAGSRALLRVQITNLFDTQGFELRSAGSYLAMPGRLAQAYVTMDF